MTGTVQAVALACGFLFLGLYQGVLESIETPAVRHLPGHHHAAGAGAAGSRRGGVLLLAIAGRPLLFASVDERRRPSPGVPVRALAVGFLLLLGLAVAATAQITGALLVFALLVAPAGHRAAADGPHRARPRA